MVSLIICMVLGNYTLIYHVKMHLKAYSFALKGLVYCLKVLNYVHYTVRYAQITLLVYKDICLACVRCGKNVIH